MSAPPDAPFTTEHLHLPSDAVQAAAIFNRNCSIVLTNLTAEKLAEAAELRLDVDEYAYRATLEMHGLRGGLTEL